MVASVGVSHADATGAEGGSDGVGVDAEAFAQSGERPALPVQLHRMVDLPFIQPAGTHGHAVALQVLGDGRAMDSEQARKFDCGGSGSVAAQ